MSYATLSNEDKLAALAEVDVWHGEREVVDQYVKALQMDDRAAIEDFESCGDDLRRMIQNKTHFVRAFAFGFTDTTLNENGWAKQESFLNCETFSFGSKVKGIMGNSVTIGQGPNGKWTYALSVSSSRSGRSGGLSVFSEPINSRRDCLFRALEKLIAWHTKENDTKTAPVIREAKDMLDVITGRKLVQLTLF